MTQLERVKQKYLNLHPTHGVEEKIIKEIEDKLDIILPNDFKAIATYYDGYYDINNHSFFSFNPNVNDWNVINKTIFYRESDLKLPKNFLVIKEGDEDVIVLDTSDLINKVYWLSHADLYNLSNQEELLDDPMIFNSFGDFFEFILNETTD